MLKFRDALKRISPQCWFICAVLNTLASAAFFFESKSYAGILTGAVAICYFAAAIHSIVQQRS